jgi:hypothetical protein
MRGERTPGAEAGPAVYTREAPALARLLIRPGTGRRRGDGRRRGRAGERTCARPAPDAASGLRPGEQVAVAAELSWPLWVPQAFEVYWTELELFTPASQPPPDGVTVVETSWPSGQPAQASWPDAPAGWRIVASDQANAWVIWRKA